MNSLVPGLDELDAPAGTKAFLIDLATLPRPEALLSALSDEERLAAMRHHDHSTSGRFIRRRWLRRHLLAVCHGVEEDRIEITSNHLGRPRIKAPPMLATLTLSTSSTSEHAIVAWSTSRAFGIDIEAISPKAVSADAAKIFMHPRELETWRSSEDPIGVFFRCWTRKEACLKSLGTGFQTDPTSLDALHEATIIDLDLPPGLAGAMVATTS